VAGIEEELNFQSVLWLLLPGLLDLLLPGVPGLLPGLLPGLFYRLSPGPSCNVNL
jgi:hypothetical protein